jgi:hydrogenase expression/formation protein HypE
MSHGSGGKATSELIHDVFSKRLGNDTLNKMEDAAVFPVDVQNGRIAYTTDSFVVTPLIFKGGDIGRLAVCGTVNDLLSMGATPVALTAGFIIEEGMELDTLERIVTSMADTLKEAGTRIVAADTKVIEGSGGLYINTSGIGIVQAGLSIGPGMLKPGDDILITGTLGDHHACILSHRMDIENDIESDAAPLNGIVTALLENNVMIRAIRDVTR